MTIDYDKISASGAHIKTVGTVRPLDLTACRNQLHNLFTNRSQITTVVETVMKEIADHRAGKQPASCIDLEKARDDLLQMRPYRSEENELILMLFRELNRLRIAAADAGGANKA
jgi:hypothetical protein